MSAPWFGASKGWELHQGTDLDGGKVKRVTWESRRKRAERRVRQVGAVNVLQAKKIEELEAEIRALQAAAAEAAEARDRVYDLVASLAREVYLTPYDLTQRRVIA